jgi:hypothetical protein
MSSRINRNKIKILMTLAMLFFPLTANAFLGKNSTGGTSVIYLGETRINVDGGFIEWYDSAEISVRGKGIDITINVDNSNSNEARSIDVSVSNINPEITKTLGLSEDEVKKDKNSVSFPVKVEANKVAVYKLLPELPKDEFMFMVFGESRGGANVFQRIIGDINYRKPLFAISCGDMVEGPTSSDFKDFMKQINNVSVPFLSVPGSSEIGEGSRMLYEDFLGSPYYSFDYMNSHFIIVDNGDSRVSEGQFLWLENDLMQNKSVNTFVFMHIPPYDPRPGKEHPMKLGEQYRRLSDILEKYKVSRVFTSGIHGYHKKEHGGVPYIITGGGGSELESLDSFHNYILVDVKGDKIKDKLIKLTFPPLGWYDSLKVKVKLSLKNSFATHPVLSSIVLLIGLFVLFIVIKSFRRRFFRRTKRRISL